MTMLERNEDISAVANSRWLRVGVNRFVLARVTGPPSPCAAAAATTGGGIDSILQLSIATSRRRLPTLGDRCAGSLVRLPALPWRFGGSCPGRPSGGGYAPANTVG